MLRNPHFFGSRKHWEPSPPPLYWQKLGYQLNVAARHTGKLNPQMGKRNAKPALGEFGPRGKRNRFTPGFLGTECQDLCIRRIVLSKNPQPSAKISSLSRVA